MTVSEPPDVAVADRIEIEDLISRYAWALDTGDVASYMRTWSAAEPTLIQGTTDPETRFEGRDAIEAFVVDLVGSRAFRGRQHFVDNLVFLPHPDGVELRSYLLITENRGGRPSICLSGQYHDICVREAGRWRFRSRHYRSWAGADPGGAARPASAGSSNGTSRQGTVLRPPAEVRFAIADLYARYLWALDEQDADALVDAFVPDTGRIAEHLPTGLEVGEGHDGIARTMAKYLADPEGGGRQHRVGSMIFESPGDDPDRWGVRAYILATEAREGSAELIWTGYYEDVVVLHGGRWLFENREIRPWSGEALDRIFLPRITTERRTDGAT